MADAAPASEGSEVKRALEACSVTGAVCCLIRCHLLARSEPGGKGHVSSISSVRWIFRLEEEEVQEEEAAEEAEEEEEEAEEAEETVEKVREQEAGLEEVERDRLRGDRGRHKPMVSRRRWRRERALRLRPAAPDDPPPLSPPPPPPPPPGSAISWMELTA